MIPKNCHLWQKQNITDDDIDLDIVKKYWDHSHSWRFLGKCKKCGQLYIDDSVEFVNWNGGDDEIFTVIVPVSEAELAEHNFNDIPPKELFNFTPVLFCDPKNRIRWIGKFTGKSKILKNLEQYKSVGQWYDHFRTNGFSVPLQLCIGLTKVMERHNFTFTQAFEFLEENGKIILAGRAFIYDMSGDEL